MRAKTRRVKWQQGGAWLSRTDGASALHVSSLQATSFSNTQPRTPAPRVQHRAWDR
jgi:hypothetical protein